MRHSRMQAGGRVDELEHLRLRQLEEHARDLWRAHRLERCHERMQTIAELLASEQWRPERQWRVSSECARGREWR